MVHLETLQEAARARREMRKRQGWYRQRKRHAIAARKGKMKAYRVFDQSRGKDTQPKLEVMHATSKKALVRKFTPFYKQLVKKKYVTIVPY